MELRRTSARRAGLAALAALLVVGASACSGGNTVVGVSPAATVNDTEISQADVTSATEATQRFYEDSIEQGQDSDGRLASLVEQLQGSGSHAVGTEGAAQVLSDMIADQVIHDELAKHDALPTAQEEKDLRSSLEDQIGKDELKKIDADYLDLYIERRALNQAFTTWAADEANKDIEPYTDAEREQQKQAYYAQYYAENPLCLNTIQTSTEAEAQQARTRVDGGEDFVTVAKSFVPEGSSIPDEGSIACLTADQAAQVAGDAIADAKVGDVVGPVTYSQSDGSTPIYLVLKVEKTDGYTYDEVESTIDAQVPTEPAAADPAEFDASDALNGLLAEADIQVNSVFGRWSDAESRVVPPNVPGTTTTTVPVAALAGS